MPITGMTLMKNATSGTTVGGTSTTFNEDGVEVKNGKHVADLAELSFALRSNITFRNRNPVLNPDGSYTKAKRTISLVVPKQLANLSYAFNLARIEIEMHPEMSAAEMTNLRMLAAQLLTDSDVISFIDAGSLA